MGEIEQAIGKYCVYAKIDAYHRLIAINSDAFLLSLTGWIKIDEGTGDRYHHAHGNYLDGGLYDTRGVPRYALIDGVVTLRDQADIDADAAAIQSPSAPTAAQRLADAETTIATHGQEIDAIITGLEALAGG